MLQPGFIYDLLKKEGVEFITGVPDSLLKNFCSYLLDQGDDLIAANEGAALSIAAGYHLASGTIPMVYLQNSGFGNLVNPYTSLVDEEVYSIPVLIMVGWRGEPGKQDEPQHIKQGKTQEAQLKALGIPYTILNADASVAEDQIHAAFDHMRTHNTPYVILVSAGTFDKYDKTNKFVENKYPLKREEVLAVLVDKLGDDDVIVSTTGKTSRELFELRAKSGQGHHRDFLTVGSMGHASQIALGISLKNAERNVFCIDGDGALIMHMGSLAVIGENAPSNFKHVLINNGAHESVGGQPTAGFSIDIKKIGEGCGYKKVFRAESGEELNTMFDKFLSAEGPVLIEIMTQTGSRENLGRPTIAPEDNKKNFMRFLSEED